MTTALPEKVNLGTRDKKTLTGVEKTKYEAYYAEKARRKNPSLPGVAQEALDCVAELEEAGRSPSEAFTKFGYSLRTAVIPAQKEEARIVKELAEKPSKDIVPSTAVALVVAEVKAAKEIPEFVKPVEPKDPVDEPVVVEK